VVVTAAAGDAAATYRVKSWGDDGRVRSVLIVPLGANCDMAVKVEEQFAEGTRAGVQGEGLSLGNGHIALLRLQGERGVQGRPGHGRAGRDAATQGCVREPGKCCSARVVG
jgi:hypothetical protein